MKNTGFAKIRRNNEVCPWWLCFTFDNPIRKLLQDPFRILSPYVKSGDSVLDIGPGMGYFTFPLSQMAGDTGRVVALDIQEGMLKRLEKKILTRQIVNIETRLYDGKQFSLNTMFDFVLLFWMYHEVNDKHAFIREIKSVVRKNTLLFIAEPKIHVSKNSFENSIRLFTDSGFTVVNEPPVALSRSLVLKMTG